MDLVAFIGPYSPFLFLNIHVSGSAYKIANNRAYHHGTMLISTQLDTLGDLLHTNKVGWYPKRCWHWPAGHVHIVLQQSMHTKGVASVRSPVRNLVQSNPSATHEAFVNAVVQSFRQEYAIDEEASNSFTPN